MISAALVAGVLGVCLSAWNLIIKVRDDIIARVDDKIIIGVVGPAPSALASLSTYSSLRKARRSRDETVVLYCRLVSYALRHCDFVVADVTCDHKVIRPSDTQAIEQIVRRHG